jgi:hypothetical protein
MPLCLCNSVVRSTLNCLATARYEEDAPGSRDSIISIAASIGFILVELRCVKVGMIGMF